MGRIELYIDHSVPPYADLDLLCFHCVVNGLHSKCAYYYSVVFYDHI